MSALLSYADALALIESLGSQWKTRQVSKRPLADCLGLLLAEDLAAPFPSPPFTNSAMDGYALKHADLAQDSLQVLGARHAEAISSESEMDYEPSGCLKIMTGAAVPDWADTVVPVEKTSLDPDGRMRVTESLAPGANLRHKGEDLPQGALLYKKGRSLRPEDLMVAASFGFPALPVWEPFQLKLLSTGSELAEPGTPLAPGMVYNASKFFLLAAAEKLGLRHVEHETLPDDLTLARSYVAKVTQEDKPTLIVSTGAVSAGDADFIPRLGAELDFVPLFHKVAIRPGKPVYLARRGSTIWLGLPGNPISTAVGWHFFARPLLAALGHVPPAPKRRFILRSDVTKPEGLRCFYRAEVSEDQRSVWIGRRQGSAHFASSLNMGAYVELPEGQVRFSAGSVVSGCLID
jgi:molybdopterin molybdotransferase